MKYDYETNWKKLFKKHKLYKDIVDKCVIIRKYDLDSRYIMILEGKIIAKFCFNDGNFIIRTDDHHKIKYITSNTKYKYVYEGKHSHTSKYWDKLVYNRFHKLGRRVVKAITWLPFVNMPRLNSNNYVVIYYKDNIRYLPYKKYNRLFDLFDFKDNY